MCFILQLDSSYHTFPQCVTLHVQPPFSRIDTATVWKKPPFILSEGSNFLMTDNLSTTVNTSCLANGDITFSRYCCQDFLTGLWGLWFKVEMVPSNIKHRSSVIFAFTNSPMTRANVVWSYADSCRIDHNDTMIKDERRLLKTNMYLSLYL